MHCDYSFWWDQTVRRDTHTHACTHNACCTTNEDTQNVFSSSSMHLFVQCLKPLQTLQKTGMLPYRLGLAILTHTRKFLMV